MIVLSAFFVVVYGLLGALWRRWMGGWKPITSKYRRPIHLATCVPLAVFAALAGGGNLYAELVAAALAVTMFFPGHGSYMVMADSRTEPDNEFLRPVLTWMFGAAADGTLRYNFTGMALRYSLFTVPAGILEVIGGDSGGWAFMGVGLIIAIAYLAFQWARDDIPATELTEGRAYTAWGELAIGFFGIGFLAL